jgi:NADH-quinone oxidoreductase subunit J
MIEQVAFLLFATITLVAAFGVVAARTVFVSALWLVGSFVGVAGLYVLLGAGFLAMIQLLVYVGAISVLILFVIMLTRDVMGEHTQRNRQWVLAAMIALALFGILAVLGYTTDWPETNAAVPPASGGTVVLGDDMTAEDAGKIPNVVIEEGEDGVAYRVAGPVESLGRSFVTENLLPFEVISALLLVALVGAIVIARE